MELIGVRELKDHATQILRKVREEGAEYLVTYHGKVIARLVPTEPVPLSSVELDAAWADLDDLAEEIGKRWPQGVSAVEAVREVRRDL
jgi:prevent-host-death family protein